MRHFLFELAPCRRSIILAAVVAVLAASQGARGQIATPGVTLTGTFSNQSGWTAGPAYPGGPFSAGSCAVWNSTITCVGGTNNSQTYTAPLTANGIGAWTQGADYGEGGQNSFLSCATGQTNYMYCTGGDNLGGETGNVTSDMWYSQLSANGALNWSVSNELLDILLLQDGGKITNGLWDSSCFIHNGVLYCVGGFIQTQAFAISGYGSVEYPVENPTNAVFANSLGVNGPSGWQTTTAYGEPIAGHSCVTYNNYAYCVGGVTGTSASTYDVADVWFAPFNSNGSLGPWQQTTSYGGGPVDGLSCTVVAGQIVCVGGNFNGGSGGSSSDVWTAPLSSSGVGTWTRILAYPESVWSASCAASNFTIACVGGGQTNGGWATLGQSIGGDVNTYSVTFTPQINLGDSASCEFIGGVWDSSTSVCAVSSSQTLPAGEFLNILPGTLLAIGAPGDCVSNCVNPVVFTSGAGVIVESGAQLLNYATFVNQGGVTVYGSFDNEGVLQSPGGFEVAPAVQNQSAGTLINNGNIVNSGIFVAPPGPAGNITVVVNGQTCFAGNSTYAVAIDPNDPFMVDGVWTNGTCEFDAPPDLPRGVVAPVTIPADVVWQIPAGTTLLNQNEIIVDGEVENAGTWVNNQVNTINTTPWDPGVLVVANLFENTGTLITENGGYTYVNGSLTNTGTIQLQSTGNLNVDAGGVLTNSSNITLAQGTTLSDLGTVDNSGTIDNSGTVTANGSVLAALDNAGGGSIVNQNGGTTDGSGGTITTSIGAPTVQLTAAYCAQIGGQWRANQNACFNNGSITLDAGTIVTIPSGVSLLNYGQLYAPGEINNYGTIVNGNELTVGPNPNYGSSSSGILYNQIGATLSNYVLLTISAGNALVNNGTILNAPTDPGYTSYVGQGNLQNYGTLTNNGVLNNYSAILNAPYSPSGSATLLNPGTITDLCNGTFANSDNLGSGSYGGNSVVNGGCSAQAPLEPTVVTLTDQLNGGPYNSLPFTQSLYLTALVYPQTAGGTLTFLMNGATTLAVDHFQESGATLSLTTLPAGSPTLSVAYSGDSAHAASVSQTYYQPSVVNAIIEWQSLAVGDFEGSGHPDVAAVQIGTSSVEILHNNGNGTFTQTNEYDTGGSSQTFTPSLFVATGDLNGDGKLDLAVATATGVTILLGNGDGTFQTPVSIAAGDASSMLALADVNGDGKLDIVLGNMGSNYVTVLLGNGDGTFQAAIDSKAANAPQAIAVGDFNNDGKPDILVGSQVDKTVSVLLGNGDGTFQPPTTVLTGFTQPISIAVADFNGDGNRDFAVADAATNQVSIFQGNGDGTFTAGNVYPVSATPLSLISADFNRDGAPDLAMVSQGAGAASVLIGNGDGTFQPQQTYVLNSATNVDPAAVAAADLNGDGYTDLVTANLTVTNYSVLFGPIGGAVAPTLTVTGGTFTYDGNSHAATCSAVNASGAVVTGSCAFTYNGSPNPPVTAGAYTVSATFTPADTTLYQTVQGSGTITIQQATPILTVTGGTFNYDGNAEAASCGAVNTAGAAVSGNCSFTYNGVSAAPVSPGNYTVSATFTPADTTDYAPAQGTANIVINQGAPTVTLTGGSFSYNGAAHAASCAVTGVGGAQVSGSCAITYSFTAPSGQVTAGSSAPVNAGTYNLSAVFTSGDPNYANASASGVTLTITPAALTVTANGATKIYGAQLPQFTVSYSGFVGSDTPASLTGTLNFSTTATAASPVGTYTLTPGGLTSSNYTISFVSGMLSITPASLTVTAQNATSVYGQPLPAFTVSYAGFVNGDGPSSLQGALQIATNAGQGSPVGSYTLTPGGFSSSNYTIAYVPGSLTITPAPLVAAASPVTRSYWAPDPPLTGTLTGVVSGDGITAVFLDTIPAGSPAGVYANAIVPQLVDPNKRLGNYTVTLVSAALTIVNPLPVLSGLSVDSVVVERGLSARSRPVELTGSNFVPQSAVQWDGTGIPTTFVDQNHLTAVIPAASLTQTGVGYLTVSSSTAGGGGGGSNAEAFFITDSPAPVTNTATAPDAANGTLTVGGKGAGTPDSLTASWTGTGDVTIAQYGADPGGPDFFHSTTRPARYYQIYVAPGSSISSLTFVECTRGSNLAYWFNGHSWQPVSQQAYNPSTGCLTVTVTSTTSPTIAQLSGTYFTTGVDFIPPFVDALARKCIRGGSDCGKGDPAYMFGAWSNQPVEIGLHARDNWGGSGVASISYSATGAGAMDQESVTGAQAQFEITAQGVTNVIYSATDYANNVSTPHTAVVKIDTTPPVVTVSANPAVLEPQEGMPAAVTISGTITDDLSGVAAAAYSVSGFDGQRLSAGPIRLRRDGSYSVTIPLPVQGQRELTVEVVATDAAGNTGSATFNLAASNK